MDKKSKYLVTTVQVDELTKNMTIIAYTGFSNRYSLIDKKVCAFIHHNFKGAKAIVLRADRKLELSVEQIQEGDSISQLFSFPSSKSRLTEVNPKLSAALKKKGILSFKIKKLKPYSDNLTTDLNDAIEQVNLLMQTPSRKQERLKQGIYQANLLVEKIKESQNSRGKGTDIMEHMMDNARLGKINSSEIEAYVVSVIKNSSSEAMSAIVNLKSSDQTYSHCIDVGVVFQKFYAEGFKNTRKISGFQTLNQAFLGGFLHDFGKAKLPKELLDSSARFEFGSYEMELIRSHPYHGAKLLQGMNMPDSIINMSLTHHVKMDESLSSSYPPQLLYNNSRFESKLLAVVDIYQALVSKRSYKRSWTPPQAIRYLSALSGVEYDEQIWDLFVQVMGEYPVGSLVVLNDDSMGFVMNVPEEGEDPFRPQVAIIRNADGKDLERHTLLDLQEEKDIRIQKDLDAAEVLNNMALESFSQLQVVA